MTNQNYIDRLRLPIIQSPMFIVGNSRLVIASSRAGIVGSFPSANSRTLEALDQEFKELILKYKPPIVITSLGNPKEVVKKVHEYGGLVYSDVINLLE